MKVEFAKKAFGGNGGRKGTSLVHGGVLKRVERALDALEAASHPNELAQRGMRVKKIAGTERYHVGAGSKQTLIVAYDNGTATVLGLVRPDAARSARLG